MNNQSVSFDRRDVGWFAGVCPEVPETDGQGRTREGCLCSLAATTELMSEERLPVMSAH